ncbi:MAG: hypothetical protein JNM95_06835 [Chitinophagaceae bacterium]|nr:hypothetical protein [Chitinophagaceae bacterium]
MNSVEHIAKVCHQAMKAFCETQQDYGLPDWEEAEDWQHVSTIEGVTHRLAHPEQGFNAQHIQWMEEKVKQGWTFGLEKDADKKTHPCLVPFEELPLFQQQKDKLFCMIVDALRD